MTGIGAHLVVDCTGSVPALEAALEMTRRGGRVVIAGIPKKPVPVDAGRMVVYERTLVGILGYANDLPRVAAMIAAGNLRPEGMITRRVPLAETPAEIARLAEDPGDDVKVLVDVSPMSEGTTTVVVPMPHMGVSVEEGTVVEWLVEEGDSVAAEQPICAIATDKVDTEVVAPADGVLARIFAQVDEDVAVGAPLAELAVGPGGAAVPDGGGAVDADSADALRRDSAAASEKGDGASRSVSGEPASTALSDSGERSAR